VVTALESVFNWVGCDNFRSLGLELEFNGIRKRIVVDHLP